MSTTLPRRNKAQWTQWNISLFPAIRRLVGSEQTSCHKNGQQCIHYATVDLAHLYDRMCNPLMVHRSIPAPLLERPLQLAEEAFVFAPSFMNCHMKVEKDSRAQDRLELHARLGTDALDHVGAFHDHDPLLRLTRYTSRRLAL